MYGKFIRFNSIGDAVKDSDGNMNVMYKDKEIPALRMPEGTIIYKAVGKVVKKPKTEKRQKPLELGRTYNRNCSAYQDVLIIAKDINGNYIGQNENGNAVSFYSAAGRLLENRSGRGLVDRGVDTKFDLKVEYDEVEVGTELVIEPVKE